MVPLGPALVQLVWKRSPTVPLTCAWVQVFPPSGGVEETGRLPAGAQHGDRARPRVAGSEKAGSGTVAWKTGRERPSRGIAGPGADRERRRPYSWRRAATRRASRRRRTRSPASPITITSTAEAAHAANPACSPMSSPITQRTAVTNAHHAAEARTTYGRTLFTATTIRRRRARTARPVHDERGRAPRTRRGTRPRRFDDRPSPAGVDDPVTGDVRPGRARSAPATGPGPLDAGEGDPVRGAVPGRRLVAGLVRRQDLLLAPSRTRPRPCT